MYDEKVELRAQDKTGADYIGGERYQEDVWRSLMRGADPRRAEKMAFEAWRARNFGNVGNLASQGVSLQS